MTQVFGSGAEMAVAVDAGRVLGLTVFRVLEKTFSGRELYCDDLVTDEGTRSSGVGAAMMAYMLRIAGERGCDTFALDSGTQRQQAHKFYFREGLAVGSFHFTRKLR
jgi:GNAT superfamily N-acetyltransferase